MSVKSAWFDSQTWSEEMYGMHHPIKPAKKQSNEKVTYYMLGTGNTTGLCSTGGRTGSPLAWSYDQEFSPEARKISPTLRNKDYLKKYPHTLHVPFVFTGPSHLNLGPASSEVTGKNSRIESVCCLQQQLQFSWYHNLSSVKYYAN